MKKYITNKVWSLLAVIVFLPYQAKRLKDIYFLF